MHYEIEEIALDYDPSLGILRTIEGKERSMRQHHIAQSVGIVTLESGTSYQNTSMPLATETVRKQNSPGHIS